MRLFKHRCPNPKCRALLAIPEKVRGQYVRCASCGQFFFVPLLLRATTGGHGPVRKAG